MKAELLKRLHDSGQVNTFKPSPIWQEAFDKYKEETKDFQVSVKCGSCYRKVLAWLKK